LFQFTPVGTTATVREVTGGNPQSATALQCWLWQAENYVFWNDGINLPVFFDGMNTARSNGTPAPPPPAATYTTSNDFFFESGYNGATGTDTVVVPLTSNFTGPNGDGVAISLSSTTPVYGIVTAGTGTNSITVRFFFENNARFPVKIGKGTQLVDTTAAPSPPTAQFPVGRMGCYGRGRVWMCLGNGKDFVAGDIVSGPSGTKALDYRDSILNITENGYLVGGGTFTVPGSIGDIRAMIFTATLDVSLGQGPLQIFTPTHVFSCDAPVDRLTWQSLTNPILTESAIGNGGLGQYSTFLTNSDTIYRSLDGIRSLILARQDFNLWLRTPISHEVQKLLARDNQALLPFGSGVFFDNRILMTASPIATATQGVYNQALVALNSDGISNLREKTPPAYDGIWPGMNIMGMVTGEFSLVERCYQFTFNPVLQTLELWEQLPESASDVENEQTQPIVGDNGTQAINWWFESAALTFNEKIGNRTFKQLFNGEILVDKLIGRVDFEAFYKPDQYPCWIPWFNWSECAKQNTGAVGDNTKPQFRPRMGLGQPSGTPCDESTNRPLREGYTFQFRLVITGQCEFLGARFAAVILPEPLFAKPNCSPVC
jgi:hypothetical protein